MTISIVMFEASVQNATFIKVKEPQLKITAMSMLISVSRHMENVITCQLQAKVHKGLTQVQQA